MRSVAVIGLGYFSQYHLAAWASNPVTEIVAIADTDPARVRQVSADMNVPVFADLDSVLANTAPDIFDLVVPPRAQASLIRRLLKPGQVIICQKPFCTSLSEAEAITAAAEAIGATLIIHENFRFQPWYREIKSFLDSGHMGQVYSARFDLRPGDGRGPGAYLARQPEFQRMDRFLVQETAVHLIDVFRWLFGPITSVYADLRQLNPAIAGEDSGILLLSHRDGPKSVFDGNRLSDHVAENPRHTMGEMVIEGETGTLTLNGAGQLHFRAFREQTGVNMPVTTPVDAEQFGGGCVGALVNHVVDALAHGTEPENTARVYLEVIRVCEAAYRSNAEYRRIEPG